MITVKCDGLVFDLPAADACFHLKISNYVRELPRGVARLPVPPQGTLVVVGACFGATVAAGVCLAGFARAVAFEPDPQNAALLARNLERNGIRDRVTIVPKAAGAATGTAKMTRCGDGNIGGHLVHQGGDPRGTVEVEVAAVDETLAALGVADVGLVWCDAQGNEPYVMAGARALLTGAVPWGIELAPGLMAGTPASAYCDPLAVFDTVYDFRSGVTGAATAIPAWYRHYFNTKSPNNPAKSWHTQLLVWKENS